ncbi:MAG TPA: hypothetical protein VG604_00870 [Candidatus Saccharimonadales bacterium]|nr:hypothetical protein [Candidatus Saccharimonadales bacterium]
MASNKKYFHDHLVLLLLSVNVFLAAAGNIFILLRLTTSHGTGYFVQYRSSLGVNAFKTGGLGELVSFIIFALLVVVVHYLLSLRAYHIHRQLAIAILYLGILLLVLTIIVSNALLVLR